MLLLLILLKFDADLGAFEVVADLPRRSLRTSFSEAVRCRIGVVKLLMLCSGQCELLTVLLQRRKEVTALAG